MFAYKGNTSGGMLRREGKEGQREREREREREGEGGQRCIPRPIQTAMLDVVRHAHSRQADARTNLFSIRPMHFKLIVPRSPYPVIILFVSLRHAAWNNSCGKKQEGPRSILFSLDTSYR